MVQVLLHAFTVTSNLVAGKKKKKKNPKDGKGRSHMGVFTARAEQRRQLRRWLAVAATYEV